MTPLFARPVWIGLVLFAATILGAAVFIPAAVSREVEPEVSRELSSWNVLCPPTLAAMPTASEEAAPATPDSSRVDPIVLRRLAGGASQQVIVLGTDQLLDRHGGLDRFAREHARSDRRELRVHIIRQLKELAERQQNRIVAQLRPSSPERRLWIVNAMLITLDSSAIILASRLQDVLYIYPAAEVLPAPRAVKLAEVLRTGPVDRFSPEGKSIPSHFQQMGILRVWQEAGVHGEGIVVAMLDTGMDYTHPDLRRRVWINSREVADNGEDDDGNGYIDDYYGYDFGQMQPEVQNNGQPHGTFTAGIVAGDGSGGMQTGIAPRSRLMVLRSAAAPVASALAYEYALAEGADIMNMSFSIPGLGNVRGLWRMMSEHAIAAGMVLVGGAGNFQQNQPIPVQHQTPKDVPAVISVGGVDSGLTLVPFSSMGPAEWGSVALYGDFAMPAGLIKPDVVAFPGPGYPLLNPGTPTYLHPNSTIRGNSFSGPQGAGIAALMLSARPSLPAWRVKQIMEMTAIDLDTPGKDNATGSGLLNAWEAVRAVFGEK